MKKALKITGIIAVIAILCVCLVACIPNDYSKAEKNLKDEGYVAFSSTGLSAALKLAGIETEAIVVGAKGTDSIALVYCKNSSVAKDKYNEIKEILVKFMDDGDEMPIKRSGKVIYIGTDAAIKAAK